ncbi:alpha/beta fold hydrolase [Mycetocola spongiae]|uniref:alpha/beta fold hydrolase n=1 Tax=Mycetocola spongiae TaxID=2859226 RepID=UPI001CF10885|nr:alpha/beta hydrolase [Mycetocola spongiae]UCR88209.1 alpha/beta hydrolase [Mycetocola spongiae]
MTTDTPTPLSFILVPGHWLGGWAWDAVTASLRAGGHTVTAVTLPGLDPRDPDRAGRTLADQADFLRAEIAALRETGTTVVLVAHSGAGFLASLLLDREPTLVERVVYVDSGPVSDGLAFNPALPAEVHEVPLPPFDQLPASLEGLDEPTLALLRQCAVPMPAAIIREPVTLVNNARRDVPSTIICCSYPAELTMRLAREGNPMMAELLTLRDLTLVDLPTGHWPMWSRPADLASALLTAAAPA